MNNDLTFLAPPDTVCDWRLVLVYAAAADAGILDSLPATPTDLANRLNLDARVTSAVLEVLCLWDIVERGVDGEVYQWAPAIPARQGSAVLRHHAAALRIWASRLQERLQPESQDNTAWVSSQPGAFQASLAVLAQRRAPLLVDGCLTRAPGARRVLDLGGGHGEYALEFARRGCQVVLQDRPAMIDVVRGWGRLEEAGVSLFAGDFFEELPDHQFDLVLCAGVTHTYDGAHNRQLYRRVRAVLAPDGLFVITCFVASDAPVSRLFALQMLLGGNGGDTHRESDYRSWLAEAGFADVDVAPLEEGGHTMLAARR